MRLRISNQKLRRCVGRASCVGAIYILACWLVVLFGSWNPPTNQQLTANKMIADAVYDFAFRFPFGYLRLIDDPFIAPVANGLLWSIVASAVCLLWSRWKSAR